MSEKPGADEADKTRPQTRIEKQVEHRDRIKRTLVACFMASWSGVFILPLRHARPGDRASGERYHRYTSPAAGVVFQKYVFMFIGVDYMELSTKDWFYQSFMTFALWFMTWTIFLTTTVLL